MSEIREETLKEYIAIYGFDFEKRRCFAIACAKCKLLWTKLGHSRRCLEGLEENHTQKRRVKLVVGRYPPAYS
jgi:hypothetical protein